MSNLLTIHGVKGYIDENGIAQLNLEDCARGLGFTTIATSGNECVRWARVEEYLGSFGFSQEVAKDSFIPENIFYRLAMKAKNETAEKFQAIVCDEILPQIRKTGSYQVKPLTQLEILAQSTQILIEQEKAIKELTANQTKQAEDLQGIRDVITLSTVSWREDTKNLLVKIARKTGDVQIVSDLWSDAYKLLDSRMGVNVKQRLVNLRKNMAIEGASKSKQSNTNTLDVIGLDKKLIEGFVAIVKEMAIKAGVA